MDSIAKTEAHNPYDLCAFLLPVVVVGGLVTTYLIAPDFYLRYVLVEHRREYQLVEISTVVAALAASLLLFACAWRLWRRAPVAGEAAIAMTGRPLNRILRHPKTPALFVALVALAAFGLGGEEVNWGQTWLGWATPEVYRSVSFHTSLHNASGIIGDALRAFGNVFLIGSFVVLPVAWLWRSELNLPNAWAPVIAEWPVTFCLAVSYLLRLFKNAYRSVTEISRDPAEPRFYWEFVEQMNEQRELLVALTFLLYALYRVARLRANVSR